MSGGYLVYDEARGMSGWLMLVGPFGYPRWTASISEATSLLYSAAHAWAAAVGTVVNGENRARVVATHRAPATAKAIIEKVESSAKMLQELSSIEGCWGGDGS